MDMQLRLKVLLGALLLHIGATLHAQPSTKAAIAPKADTAKATVKLVAAFGAYTNGSKASAADFIRLLTANPVVRLKAADGSLIPVVSFEFIWKKKDVSDDIRTGKPKTVYNYVGATIKGNKLTDSWKEELTNYLQKGEEITFDTILYYDTKKKVNIKASSIIIAIN